MIPLRNKDAFDVFSIFQFEQIFARTVSGSLNIFYLQAADRKMIIQKRADILGNIRHPVKLIRLVQIDPF